VRFLSQVSAPAKMMTKVEQEEVSGGKTATVVNKRIKFSNVVLLTVIHLVAIYTIVFVFPRLSLATLIWCRYRLSSVTHLQKYLSIHFKKLKGNRKQQQLCGDVLLSVIVDFERR
jgi:hypothetical protein